MTQIVEKPETTHDVYAAIQRTLEEWRERLVAASHDIHDHPELAFEEHRSAGIVADLLTEAGFRTEVGVYDQPTAIEAVYGSGSLTVAVCAEYDALPGVGHACGHNIIATAGVGTAIALAALADELDLTVKLLGTPAEEVGGGKALMLEAGAWEDATVSVMVHPGPSFTMRTRGAAGQGRDRFRVTFNGLASHAAAAPQVGINAGNAATILHVALGLLRQHVPDGVRLGAVTLSGGDVSNIIPAQAVLEGEVRSSDAEVQRDLKTKFLACVEGAAIATGCTYDVTPVDPVYQPIVQHEFLADAYDEAMERLGRTVVERPANAGGGSTDMGNVSQVVPTIHPMIAVLGSQGMPHTAEFASETDSAGADEAIVAGAYGLACAVADLASDPIARDEVLEAQRRRPAGATRVPAFPSADQGAKA
ncbi:M20 family metallopeptidase [Nocardioides insulae]|uniref:M20 family metallopeptidase n=1 Tax=Nocardioides insulae TaxID=394734 RepID=UPI00041D9A49|nr:M20 family metallopeptidase [Nocardioides insulae]